MLSEGINSSNVYVEWSQESFFKTLLCMEKGSEGARLHH